MQRLMAVWVHQMVCRSFKTRAAWLLLANTAISKLSWVQSVTIRRLNQVRPSFCAWENTASLSEWPLPPQLCCPRALNLLVYTTFICNFGVSKNFCSIEFQENHFIHICWVVESYHQQQQVQASLLWWWPESSSQTKNEQWSLLYFMSKANATHIGWS